LISNPHQITINRRTSGSAGCLCLVKELPEPLYNSLADLPYLSDLNGPTLQPGPPAGFIRIDFHGRQICVAKYPN